MAPLVVGASEESILEAARIVKRGGIVVYPTDTVYGLGCDPFNEEAVRRLFKVKRRPDKPLPVLALNLKNAERIAHFSEEARKVAQRFWPGGLTLVLPKKEALPSIVTAGLKSVAVRVPNHPVALKLIELCGGLLIGTSANVSGGEPSTTAQEAQKQLGRAVDAILNGGAATLTKPSTILDLTSGTPSILREGALPAAEILKFLSGLKK